MIVKLTPKIQELVNKRGIFPGDTIEYQNYGVFIVPDYDKWTVHQGFDDRGVPFWTEIQWEMIKGAPHDSCWILCNTDYEERIKIISKVNITPEQEQNLLDSLDILL